MSVADDQLELVRWALRAKVTPHPTIRIGEDRVKVVLAALVVYANTTTLIAWPSAQTLADDIGMPAGRRVVRDALATLSSSGLIERVEGPSRSAAWRLLAGMPATPEAPDVAGNVAGNVAGDVAGMPATNKNENKNTPPAPHSSFSRIVHKHEPNARNALTTIVGSRRLPFTVEELLAIAYTHPTGDPWEGYRVIKTATATTLDSARDPRTAGFARMRDAGLSTPRQKRAA